ncbi:MAG: PEP-CTERM sorting domain-containing protein [Tepidisphaeraceae bacterium]|jgi:hypothetical protein
MQRKMKRSMIVNVAAVTVASLGISTLHAASNASDNASNSPYVVFSAFSGQNGGTGFGPWTVNVTGSGGDYINNATYDNTGVVTTPNFDIWNDTNDGTGGGTYGVDVTTAIRPFTSALSPDQIFKFSDVLHYANQTQGGGSALGWSLEDSSGNALFDFHTAGGAAGYFLSDANNSDTLETTVPYNYQDGDTFAFELNDSSGDYTLTVTCAPTGNVTGGSQTFTGQISMATGGPSQVAIYNNNGEGGSDIEFNTLAITSVVAPQQWISSSSGDWNNASNWSGVVPNAVGAEADFFAAITSNHTVFTDQAVTVGTINFNNANTYEITGTGSLTLQASSGNAQVIVQQGTQEINLPTTIASNTVFNVAAGANLIIGNPLTIDSGDSLTQTGSGTVTYQSIITVQSLALMTFADLTHAHELNLASSATATVSAPVLQVDSLSNLGTVNLQNNEMIINYGSGSDPISSIRSQIISGYNGGHWNGPGIISTTAQTKTNGLSYGVGYADGADNKISGLSSGQIEVAYTLLGDGNLDGLVNAADFTILAANFNQPVTGWDQGDFNYDGLVNAADFTDLAANFNQSVSGATVSAGDVAALDAFAAANGLSLLASSVPEPASAVMMAMAGLGILRRRRRSSRQANAKAMRAGALRSSGSTI